MTDVMKITIQLPGASRLDYQSKIELFRAIEKSARSLAEATETATGFLASWEPWTPLEES